MKYFVSICDFSKIGHPTVKLKLPQAKVFHILAYFLVCC